ncbi:MAG: 7-cyano-7-deazaguanine synthase [Candidatus Hydrothermarchaeales archaeon]
MKAIVLLSDGLDSATSLWGVKDEYEEVHTLTFAYGLKDEEVMLTQRLSVPIPMQSRITSPSTSMTKVGSSGRGPDGV